VVRGLGGVTALAPITIRITITRVAGFLGRHLRRRPGAGEGAAYGGGITRRHRMQLGHERLDVYAVAVDLARFVRTLPVRRGEAALYAQLRRAADSVALNVAEAVGRAARDEQNHFLIARGSASECAAAFDILGTIGAISQEDRWRGRECVARLVAMLTRLGRPRE
jgi:four helix bundle protein